MKLSKHLLKRIIREGIEKKGECISDQMMVEYVNGNVSQQQYKQIIDHLESCMKCTDLWRSYEIFIKKNIYIAPASIKEKVYKNIIGKQNFIINLFQSPYVSIAAILLLVITMSFLVYIYSINKEAKILLLKQNKLIENLKQDRLENVKRLALLKNELEKKNKEILIKQNPIIDVPIYDLFPEGIYQRSANNYPTIKIIREENKPLHFILNLSKELQGNCIIQILDNNKRIVWQTYMVCKHKNSLTLLIPSIILLPNNYVIEIRKTPSLELLVSYKFVLKANSL